MHSNFDTNLLYFLWLKRYNAWQWMYDAVPKMVMDSAVPNVNNFVLRSQHNVLGISLVNSQEIPNPWVLHVLNKPSPIV